MEPTAEAIYLRRRTQLSRAEFGARLGVSRWTVRRWETPDSPAPSERDLLAMRAVVAAIEAAKQAETAA